MTRDVFARVLGNVGGRGAASFCLCGIGEPLLHPRWQEFACAIRMADPAPIYCYTNGWDLSGRTGQQLIDSPIDVLMVSVHSYDTATRNRLMRLPAEYNVLEEIDALLNKVAKAPHSIDIRVGQVELPGLPKDQRLERWCAERGVTFESWPNWNRAGHVRLEGTTSSTNVSPHACYHYASTIFIDHKGRALSCCCDANTETGAMNACTSPLEEIVDARLSRLASGEPLTPLCAGCDAELSNKPFLSTSFYVVAQRHQRSTLDPNNAPGGR
jgi:hypothetical protein